MHFELLGVVSEAPLVTLDDMKEHAIVGHADDDKVLQRCISAAEGYVGHHTHRSLHLTRYRAFSRCWPADGLVTLRHGPARLIEAVQYVADDDTVTLIDPSRWSAKTIRDQGTLLLDTDLPSPKARRLDAVQIEYLAGYGVLPDMIDDGQYDAEYPVPYEDNPEGFDAAMANMQHAIRGIAAHFFENRESVVIGPGATEVPMFVQSLLDQVRLYHL